MVETKAEYEEILDKRPKLKWNWNYVIAFTPFIYNSVSPEHAERVVRSVLSSLPQQDYLLLAVNTPVELKLQRTKSEKRNYLIDLAEKELKKKVDWRKLQFYLCFEGKYQKVYDLLSTSFKDVREGKQELFSQLAYLFGGEAEEPFFFPLKWEDTGFRILGKKRSPYGEVLFEGKAPTEVISFGLANVFITLDVDFFFAMRFRKPSIFEYQTRLENMLNSYSKKESVSAGEVVGEFAQTLADVLNEKESLWYYSTLIVLFGDDRERLGSLAETIQKDAKQIGAFLYRESSGLSQLVKLFENNKQFFRGMKLERKIVESSFSVYFPLLKHGTGRKDRIGAVYRNPSGEPVFVSQHSPTGHGTVIGSTGAGKSVDITWSSLFDDATVFIEYIERDTGSYKPFLEVVEGIKGYIPISVDRPLSVNPFGKSGYKLSAVSFLKAIEMDYRQLDEPDVAVLEEVLGEFESVVEKDKLLEKLEETGAEYLIYLLKDTNFTSIELQPELDRVKLSFATSILTTMIAGEEGKVSPEEKAVASKVVSDVYSSHDGSREVVLSDFYDRLKDSSDPVERSVAKKLFKFTKEGEYGYFFDYPTDLSRDTKNLYIELRTLSKELLNPVMLSLLQFVLDLYSDPKLAGWKRRLVIDEGWSVFKNEYLTDFLDSALRTFRKKGIAITFTSQSPKDFSPTLVSQTTVRLFKFLTEIENLKQGFTDLTEDDVEEIKYLRKPEDLNYVCSEVYVQSPLSLIGRSHAYLFLPDFYYWLSTTKPEDKVVRYKTVAKTGDILKAIKELGGIVE